MVTHGRKVGVAASDAPIVRPGSGSEGVEQIDGGVCWVLDVTMARGMEGR